MQMSILRSSGSQVTFLSPAPIPESEMKESKVTLPSLTRGLLGSVPPSSDPAARGTLPILGCASEPVLHANPQPPPSAPSPPSRGKRLGPDPACPPRPGGPCTAQLHQPTSCPFFSPQMSNSLASLSADNEQNAHFLPPRSPARRCLHPHHTRPPTRVELPSIQAGLPCGSPVHNPRTANSGAGHSDGCSHKGSTHRTATHKNAASHKGTAEQKEAGTSSHCPSPLTPRVKARPQ